MQVLILGAAGILLGFLYGAATDVFDWGTFYRGNAGLGFVPGMSPLRALTQFGRFYVLTSLFWDSFRAAGNGLMIAVLGRTVLTAMTRYRRRFTVTVSSAPSPL